MRKFFLSLFLSMTVVAMFAQSRVAYIYSSEILKDYPKYIEAKKYVDDYAKKSQENVDTKLNDVKALFNIYTSAEDKNQRELESLRNMILSQEKAANDYQESLFGKGGEIEKMQEKFMRPIEEEIMMLIKAIAEKSGYDMVFDLSVVKNTVYQSPKIDLTSLIKSELGIK